MSRRAQTTEGGAMGRKAIILAAAVVLIGTGAVGAAILLPLGYEPVDYQPAAMRFVGLTQVCDTAEAEVAQGAPACRLAGLDVSGRAWVYSPGTGYWLRLGNDRAVRTVALDVGVPRRPATPAPSPTPAAAPAAGGAVYYGPGGVVYYGTDPGLARR